MVLVKNRDLVLMNKCVKFHEDRSNTSEDDDDEFRFNDASTHEGHLF